LRSAFGQVQRGASRCKEQVCKKYADVADRCFVDEVCTEWENMRVCRLKYAVGNVCKEEHPGGQSQRAGLQPNCVPAKKYVDAGTALFFFTSCPILFFLLVPPQGVRITSQVPLLGNSTTAFSCGPLRHLVF
jgi:hypothetical protein